MACKETFRDDEDGKDTLHECDAETLVNQGETRSDIAQPARKIQKPSTTFTYAGKTVLKLPADTAKLVLRRNYTNRIPLTIELAYDIIVPDSQRIVTPSQNLLLAFAEMVKYRDISLVSEYMRQFAIANMKLIMTTFNVATDLFCRKFVRTSYDVLKILLEAGDDGIYTWIPSNILLDLFFMLRDDDGDNAYDSSWWQDQFQMKREQVLEALSLQFIKYVYTRSPLTFDTIGGRRMIVQKAKRPRLSGI